MIKSFRGLLADGAVERIRLGTIQGLTGYKIHKFQLMPYVFGAGSGELESIVKIFSRKQTTADEFIDFSNPLLLGAAIINNNTAADDVPTVLTSVFDHVTFNQDIYVTHKNQHGDLAAVSWYLELETVKLQKDEAAVATLKDMRGRE